MSTKCYTKEQLVKVSGMPDTTLNGQIFPLANGNYQKYKMDHNNERKLFYLLQTINGDGLEINKDYLVELTENELELFNIIKARNFKRAEIENAERERERECAKKKKEKNTLNNHHLEEVHFQH